MRESGFGDACESGFGYASDSYILILYIVEVI